MSTTEQTERRSRLVPLSEVPAGQLQRRLFACLNSADEGHLTPWQQQQHYQRAETYWTELCRRGYAMWSTNADEAT
ncbi:MAG TPA: hypothetical protein PKJ41_11955 [Bryobacteraceae bacterium]|nr:hypothetical protein [Bryobacteraceae bacterium]